MSEGKVDLEDVLRVLRSNGISVKLDKSGDYARGTYILKRQNQIVEAIELPKQCRRKLVRTLSRKYQIEMRLFYFRERGESDVKEAEPGTTTIQSEAGDASQDASDKPNGVPRDSGAGS